MRRHFRSLVALIAAYGILFAAVFGALASVHTANFGASVYCNGLGSAAPPPPAPARHDLDCCIACYSAAGGIAPPKPEIRIRIGTVRAVLWPARIENLVRLATDSSHARAPPPRV